MEMKTKEFEEDTAPQERAETVKSMEDTEIDIEIPTSTMVKVVPQEPAPPMELAEQMDSMMTMEVDPQKERVGESSIF